MDNLPAGDTDHKMGRAPLKLRVSYCGGCNPDIDRAAVVNRFQEIVAAAGHEVICGCDDPDVILLVNGCVRACIEQEDHPGLPGTVRISVRGAHVDDEDVAEARLHEVIWERIKKLLTMAASNGPQ